MLKRCQLGHCTDQTRICTLDPHLLFDSDFGTAVGEDVFGFVVGWSSRATTECVCKSIAKTEACERWTTSEWCGAASAGCRFEGADVEDECGVCDAEVEREVGRRWGIKDLKGVLC